MPILQVIVLAVVQGLTEFLPISSTAHLYLTSWLLHWNTESLSFDIMLHLGTLVAVLVYFARDWVQIIAHGFGMTVGHDKELEQNRALLSLLAIGSIPIGVIGFLFQKQAESTLRTPWVMGVMLILIGLLMWWAEKWSRGVRDLGAITVADAITIGAAQALAVIPGCSRSGITISAGLFRNLTRESAARFSFLLSTPAIAAAAAKAVWDVHKHGGGLHSLVTTDFLVGVVVSAITGCVVIAWFLRYLRGSSLRPFVYYRIVCGIIVLVLAALRPAA